MNEAEGLGEESGMTIPDAIPDEEDGEVDVAEMMATQRVRSSTPAWMCDEVKTSSSFATPQPPKSGKHCMTLRAFEIGPCALGGHAQGRHHGDEPPTPVANLMRQQQVVIAPAVLTHPHQSRSASHQRRFSNRHHTRMTLEMFTKGGMSADFNIIKKNIGEMSNLLRRKRIINVKSETGTNVTFEVNWREWKLDDNGICNRPRMLTNLPAGKIFTLPREGTMNGTIVIDGSWDSDLVDEPVFLHVENGLVVDVKGGTAAAQIRQTFGEAARRLKSKDQENVWTIAEFGFGMNLPAWPGTCLRTKSEWVRRTSRSAITRPWGARRRLASNFRCA